jgi:hypothetical protein
MGLPPAIKFFLHIWAALTLDLELIATGYPFVDVVTEEVVAE